MTEKSANGNSEILLDNYSSKKIFKGEMKKHLSNYKIHNKFKMRILPECVYRTVKCECNELNGLIFSNDKEIGYSKCLNCNGWQYWSLVLREEH